MQTIIKIIIIKIHLYFKQHRLPQTLLQTAAIQELFFLIFSLYVFLA